MEHGCEFVGGEYANRGAFGLLPFNGNADDASGNGHHGILGGEVGHDSPSLTADRLGNQNSAYEFDAYRELIKLPASTIDGQSTLSLTFWIKVVNSSSSMGIITGSNSGQYNEYLIMINSNGLYVHVKGQDIYANRSFTDDAWHFITVIRI